MFVDFFERLIVFLNDFHVWRTVFVELDRLAVLSATEGRDVLKLLGGGNLGVTAIFALVGDDGRDFTLPQNQCRERLIQAVRVLIVVNFGQVEALALAEGERLNINKVFVVEARQ